MIPEAEIAPETKQLIAEINKRDAVIEKLQFELDQLRRMVFGVKSERFISTVHPSQLSLLEMEPVAEPAEETTEVEKHERKKSRKKENPLQGNLPSHLPREVVKLFPEGFDENSPEKPIGVEVTETLEEIPARMFVKRIERYKFSKKNGQGVLCPELPSRPFEKSIFGTSVVTRILIDKYVDHLPLYRQEERFKRAGIQIPYSTLGDVPHKACLLLEPLYEKLRSEVLSSTYIQADETPHPVLDSRVKGKTHRGYLWVYRSKERKLVLFDYRPGRGKDGPRKLLKDFNGFLQSDGYSAYEEFGLNSHITLVGCMAHARRYFEKALDNDRLRAEHALSLIQKLYMVEKTIKEEQLQEEEILQLRRQESLPVYKQFESWLKEQINLVTPSSAMGKALSYSLARITKLGVYLCHAPLEIDNNLVENAIRPTVLGRKNYLFSGSHEGAQRSAMMYSFLGSCKINEINPEAWLRDVLERISDMKISELSNLLPGNWKSHS